MLSRLLSRLAALRGLRADLAALGLGALAAASLPPFHAIPVLLISVPGLLVLLDAASSPLVAARRGWWFGLGHHVLGLYWVTEAILFEAARFWWLVPLAVPALAAALALFIAAACFMARLTPSGWPRVLALAGAWVLADLARQFVLTGFPWNPWGSVWAIPGPIGDVFIQPAAWIGVHGLTLATLLLAALPVLGWRWRAAGTALFAAWGALGLIRLQQTVPPQPLTVMLVQGNVAQGQKWSQDLAVGIFRHYLALTSQAQAAGPAVVIWPETSFPALLDIDEPARRAIAQATRGAPALVGSARSAWLVSGTNDAWFGNSTGPRQHRAAARMRAVEEGLPLLRAANTGSSAAFDAHGHEIGRIGMQTTDTLAVTLPGVMPETLFARLGLWLPAISGSVALGAGLVARRIAPSG